MQDKTEWKLNGQVLVFTLPLSDQVRGPALRMYALRHSIVHICILCVYVYIVYMSVFS